MSHTDLLKEMNTNQSVLNFLSSLNHIKEEDLKNSSEIDKVTLKCFTSYSRTIYLYELLTSEVKNLKEISNNPLLIARIEALEKIKANIINEANKNEEIVAVRERIRREEERERLLAIKLKEEMKNKKETLLKEILKLEERLLVLDDSLNL